MDSIYLYLGSRRNVTLCNHNFSQEGIYHPDRIMSEYDLLYMQNGVWDIIEDNITYHLEPGSVLLLEPGKHHYSLTKCTPMMRNIYIHFSVHSKDNLLNKLSPFMEPSSIPASVSPTGAFGSDYLALPKLVQTDTRPEIRHSFERVIDAFWSSASDTSRLRCNLFLENLLLQLSDLDTAVNNTDILISEIIHRFHSEPEKFFSPSELAADYQVSVRTISGRFKKCTGQSLHQYQLHMKLDMVYDLLPISPGRSLHDIALSYGFYDEFQFSKLFKKKFGISPSERR